MSKRILVIKHGALGDWILATGAYKLIRETHSDARITLLTQSNFFQLAQQTGWFDEIIIDNRGGGIASLFLLFQLRQKKFTHVFDLQRSQRTWLYYQALRRSGMNWSGKIRGCAGYFIDAPNEHILKRIAIQLAAIGINAFPEPDLSWLKAEISQIKPASRYAIIIPGCAAHRVGKKWAIEGYLDVIAHIYEKGITALLVGGKKDQAIIESILQSNQNRFGLMHAIISLPELGELARYAEFCLGIDTGPTHIVAAMHTPCLVLFCNTEGTIQRNLPYGRQVRAIEVDSMQDLASEQVILALEELLPA